MKKLIEDFAISEILNPTFNVTKQLLSVCPITMIDNIPIIEDIIFSKDNDYAEVYFPNLDCRTGENNANITAGNS